jgi:hypothetical protein
VNGQLCVNESPPVQGTRGDCESLRWYPWPCACCSGGLTALDLLGGRIGSSARLAEQEREERTAVEVRQLAEWIFACSQQGEATVSLPLLAEGSEHRVLVDVPAAAVYKQTLPGTYGDLYYLVETRVHQRGCTPHEYLLRMALWEQTFGLAPATLGMTEDHQIVSVQPFVSGRFPTQEELNAFMLQSDFADVRSRCFLWKRELGEEVVWAGDVRDENFVLTEYGMVAIDVRVWLA